MEQMKNFLKGGMLTTAMIAIATVTQHPRALGAADDGEDKYQARETTLDLFASGSVGQQTLNHISHLKVNHDLRLGAGAGLNYFLTRHFGLGAEAYSENTAHSFIDSASGSLIGRFPLGQSGLSPYVYGGGGRQFDPAELWFCHAGGGLEFRFTRKFGAFADGRYVCTDGTKNYGLARVGLRLGF
jgi:hypothetical protein